MSALAVRAALAELPVTRLALKFRALDPIRLPDYAGSLLRGTFGAALRRMSCITRKKECPGCPVLRSCPYTTIFEPPPPANGHALQKFTQVPAAYIVEPPSWGPCTVDAGGHIEWSMVLAGKAVAQLPLVLLAWQQAAARGLGRGRGAAVLDSVAESTDSEATEIYRPEHSSLRSPVARLAAAPRTAGAVTLRFQTPLRLQHQGQPLGPDRVSPRALLMALVRRIALIAEFHGGAPLKEDFAGLAKEAEKVRGEHTLEWRDWRRYSSRQDRAMTLGGVVGEWRLEGSLAPFLPYIHAGQWLHVGKNATFGLGRYTAEFH